MECFFHFLAPKSTNSIIILKPTGRTFINGLSTSYDSNYPSKLEPYINENIFKQLIVEINETLINYWPCTCARVCGYLCCLCSLGLSFLLPNLCIKDAEIALDRQMDHYNQSILKDRGLEIRLIKKCSTSWLEMHIKKQIKNEKNEVGLFIESGNEMTDS